MLTELKSAVPAVESAWESIKLRVKQRNEAVRSKKAAAKAAAAEEQEKLANTPATDISGDGGVLVQVH